MILTSLALMLAGTDASAASAALCPPARIARDQTGRRTNVHRTATLASGKVAKLGSGEVVYVCAAKGSWYWVHFADGRHKCYATSAGLDARYASTCATGWIQRHRLIAVAR